MARKTRKRKRNGSVSSETPSVVEPRRTTTVVGDDDDAISLQAPNDDDDQMRDSSDDQIETSATDAAIDRSVVDAIDSNTALLQQLMEQVVDLQHAVSGDATSVADHSNLESEHAEECERLRDRVFDLECQVGELEQQNSDLAAQVASTNVRETVGVGASGCSEALSWDQRKELILEQMEDDSFDAESFIESLNTPSESEEQSPEDYVANLNAELERRDSELERRETEIQELRHLLDQQSETRDSGVAIGAAAIAEMVDQDELIQQERERLQLLQAEWEEKFRQGEIEASLERAKLSRERQELAKKQAELEEQLEHLRRESRQSQEGGSAGSSRRWMVKLGLADTEN